MDDNVHDASAYGGELVLDTRLVVHVEQIVGGAACECAIDGCSDSAVLFITSEPDMEPGAVCRTHAFDWLGVTMTTLERLFPAAEA